MDIVRRNDSAPHVIVIGIKAEVHEKLPTGEISGSPVLQQERVFRLDATDRATAVSLLDEVLRSIRDRQS